LEPKKEGESALCGSVVEECMKGKVVGEKSDTLFTGEGKGHRERERERERESPYQKAPRLRLAVVPK
jgi:hypothetical protein